MGNAVSHKSWDDFFFFFSVVHNSGQLDMDNTKHLISFIRNPGRFKDVCLTSFYTSHCPL